MVTPPPGGQTEKITFPHPSHAGGKNELDSRQSVMLFSTDLDGIVRDDLLIKLDPILGCLAVYQLRKVIHRDAYFCECLYVCLYVCLLLM